MGTVCKLAYVEQWQNST